MRRCHTIDTAQQQLLQRWRLRQQCPGDVIVGCCRRFLSGSRHSSLTRYYSKHCQTISRQYGTAARPLGGARRVPYDYWDSSSQVVLYAGRLVCRYAWFPAVVTAMSIDLSRVFPTTKTRGKDSSYPELRSVTILINRKQEG